MKNKRIILFITSEQCCTLASSAKEYLARVPNVLSIILSEREFGSSALNIFEDFLHRKLKFTAKISEHAQDVRNRVSFDLVPKTDVHYHAKSVTYQKMANVIERYAPEAIVLSGHKLIAEAIATKAFLRVNTKIVVAPDGYVLNKQYINHFADAYLVDNKNMADTLIANGVDEAKITVTGVPTRPCFLSLAEDKNGELSCEADKPTLLIARKRGDKRFDHFRVSTAFNVLDVTDDDKEDLNVYFSCADIILTAPCVRTCAKALVKNKLLVLFGANTHEERLTAEYLSSDFAIYCKSVEEVKRTLEEFIKQDPAIVEKTELLKHNPTSGAYEAFGSAIAKIIG